MKKLLLSLFFFILFHPHSYAQVYSFQCKEMYLNFMQGNEFDDLKNIKNFWLSFNDKTSILMVEPDYINKKNNTTGRVTFVFDNRKEYFYLSNYDGSRFSAYNYEKLTKEYAGDYKSLKPLVGKFKDNRFLNFKKIKSPMINSFYDLYYTRVWGLYSVDSSEFPIVADTFRFICKE